MRQVNDQKLIRYLTGALSEKEKKRVEQNYFQNNEAFEFLLTIEDKIIEKYTLGKLTKKERKLFEQNILPNQRIQENIRSAKVLEESIRKISASNIEREKSIYETIVQKISRFFEESFAYHPAIKYGVSNWSSVWNFTTGSSTVTCSVLVASGWNMVSVPLTVSDYRKIILFPNATSNAFTYKGSYVIEDTLKNGVGYWLKFANEQTVNITGGYRLIDTIDVRPGWNMIGSISSPVPVNTIASEPSGIITSNFFKHDAGSGYQTTGIINPGIGYWVKVNQAGKLILSSSGLVSSANLIKIVHDGEMPPTPPEMISNSEKLIPKEFGLEQNYPNPFNPTTVISYSLPVNSWVNLKVYNTLGQEVAVLVDELQDAGYKAVEWNAGGLPSGVYIYKLNAGAYSTVKKMLLVR